MSWITFTPDELNEYLPAAWLRALRTKALAVGQADPLPELIAEVITQVRTRLASGGYPLEQASNTVPPVLRTAVAFMTIALAQARLPGLALTAEQRAQIENAEAMLKKIEAREVAIEAPAVPDSTLSAPGGSIRTVGRREANARINTNDLRRLS